MLLSAFQESVCQEPMRLTPWMAFLNSKNIKEKKTYICLWNVKRAVYLSKCDDFGYCLFSFLLV